MKLLDVFSIINEAQFLVERDVLNAKELKQWVAQQAENIQNPPEQNWFKSQLFKYLINRYNEFIPVTQPPADAPEWLIAKLQAGEPVIHINPEPELYDQTQQVIDWLNAVPNNNLRMTWEEAVAATVEWHEDLKRASRVTELTDEQLEGLVTLVEYPNGFKWVDVQTEVCLRHEGTLMGHCVGQGGYTQGVKEGTTKIISLRDPKGLPHATIEGRSEQPIAIPKSFDPDSPQRDLFAADNAIEESFKGMSIQQIKGKENKPVVAKYRDYVLDFVTKFHITKFTDYGRNDLENAGIYQLKKGGFDTIENVGQEITTLDDGTTWHRIDGRNVHLENWSGPFAGKWVLFDSNGRVIGQMEEEDEYIITSIGGGFYGTKGKYREHIRAAFNNDKVEITPGHGAIHTLMLQDLAVNYDLDVGHPWEVGDRMFKTDAGVVYASNGGPNHAIPFWLIKNQKIVSLFNVNQMSNDGGTLIRFNERHGLPSGSVLEWIKEVQKNYVDKKGSTIHAIQIGGHMHLLADLLWQPSGKDELLFEEDGVRFYRDGSGWYDAIDQHGQLIFNLNIEKTDFKHKLVSDPKVAGFYAVYLFEHLRENEEDFDIEDALGDNKTYNSFATEFFEQTGWFLSDWSTHWTWMVEDDKYPILMSISVYFDDGDEEVEMNEEEVPLGRFWMETQLKDTGLEADYFINEYDSIYNGRGIFWEEELYGEEAEHYEGRIPTSREFTAQGNGDPNTVTHPVSGGTVEVKK